MMMRMKKRVLIDVDDVVAGYRKKYVEEAERELGRSFFPLHENWDVEVDLALSPEEIMRMNLICNGPGFAASLPEMEGAVQGVQELNEFLDVYFVTAPVSRSPTWIFDRTAWLVEKFGNVLGKKIVPTKHKHIIGGDFFIEDKPANAMKWVKEQHRIGNHEARAYLRDWPYNRDWRLLEAGRFYDWVELVDDLRVLNDRIP